MILYTHKHQIEFQIDEQDYARVALFKWHIDSGGYPRMCYGYPVRLHEYLLGYPEIGLEWDHINRDKKDNRRANLRQVTSSQNKHNRVYKSGSSGYSNIYAGAKNYKIRMRLGDGKRVIFNAPSLEEAIILRDSLKGKLRG